MRIVYICIAILIIKLIILLLYLGIRLSQILVSLQPNQYSAPQYLNE